MDGVNLVDEKYWVTLDGLYWMNRENWLDRLHWINRVY